MRVIERPFSDLLRHPNDVTGDLEDGDVLLRRRNEPDLRLTLADRDATRASTVSALGRAMRNLALQNPTVLATALGDAFSWTEFLPTADRGLFVEEFSRVMVASADLDNYAPVSQLVAEWRATAEMHADPKLARRLKRALHADGAQVKPVAG